MAVATKLPLLALVASLFLHAAPAEIICEDIPNDMCAFAIASCGKRCSLETFSPKNNDEVEYQCRTSEVIVKMMTGYIESDQCVRACGVDRRSVGISSDALLEPQFTSKLCRSDCYWNCPNIVDLYFNLAAGEGVYLPDICVAQRANPHRTIIDLLSSGAAPGPISVAVQPSTFSAVAPSPTSM